MKTKSTITGKLYEPEECVFICNALQSYKYLQAGLELLDLICGDNNKLVFVWDKKASYPYYDKWCKREL